MVHYNYPVAMEIAGQTALWTRPDSGDSPISYPVPTPSAVRGMFESVLWGPDILIIPRKVEICAPIQYHSAVFFIGYLAAFPRKDDLNQHDNAEDGGIENEP